ncbi:MarR family winged helix-turn-helix transcriptional regulator [Priestia koreensis]|uniref:MarR family winged helix-turn-helix transcriptional regulator n=1 Tax=Priestia koreensis TaxID=284581 RepID=UPI001F5951F3|nr:MarR family transcriptional regulator [Priestia koreensis]UNL83535.1 MarR family transcriptional regulator [Priestia koreensis]
MDLESLGIIEHEIALLVRLTTAYSPKLGTLDRSEYLLLSQLEQKSPLAINEIAEQLMLNLSTASRQVATLESKKLISRYPDPKNGRVSLLEITAEGKHILTLVQKARQNAYAEVLGEWTEEELKVLETNLKRLNRDFKRWGR